MPDWLTDVLGSIDIGQAIIIVLAGVIALFFIIKKLWPGLVAAVRLSEMLGKLPGFIERTDTSIASMKTQILNSHPTDPNMREEITAAKDSAARAVELAEGMHGRMDALAASDQTQTKLLEDVQEKLTRDHGRITKIEQTLTPAEVAQLKKIIEKEANQ